MTPQELLKSKSLTVLDVWMETPYDKTGKQQMVLLSDALEILNEALKLQRESCANAWAEYKVGDYKTIWNNILNAPEV